MGVPVLFCTICYLTVQISISDFRVFPNYLCVHIFHANTFFVATRYFSLYSSGKIVILLSQHSKRQSLSIRSLTEMDQERSRERKVEPDWSPGFARNCQAASNLVGEARMPDARSPTEFCG